MTPTSPLKWTVWTLQRIVQSEHIISAVFDSGASLGRRRGFFVIFRANVFHDCELPRRGSVDGVVFDRTIDLCTKVLYEADSGPISADFSLSPRR